MIFNLRTGLAGLFQDKRRCSDDRCVMCDSGEVEDVDHFLIGCTEFGKGWKALLEELRGVEGAGEWLIEFERVGTEGKVALLLGKGTERMSNEVMEVSRCVMCS